MSVVFGWGSICKSPTTPLESKGATDLSSWAYFIGVFIGPIIAGNIGAHVSWRWFFWVCTIAQGVSAFSQFPVQSLIHVGKVNLIMMFFMFPETRYIRPAPSSSGSFTTASDDRGSKDGSISITTQTTQYKQEKDAPLPSAGADQVRTIRDRVVGKPSRMQFSIIPRPQFETKDIIFRDIIAPIQIFTFPIICWVAFAFGFSTNCLLALNLTQSQVFAAPPYLFNPAQVGFVNFAFVVGGIIGLMTAGPFSDWISMRATKKNGGVREAEMRLVALVPYIAICLVGMVVSV